MCERERERNVSDVCTMYKKFGLGLSIVTFAVWVTPEIVMKYLFASTEP